MAWMSRWRRTRRDLPEPVRGFRRGRGTRHRTDADALRALGHDIRLAGKPIGGSQAIAIDGRQGFDSRFRPAQGWLRDGLLTMNQQQDGRMLDTVIDTDARPLHEYAHRRAAIVRRGRRGHHPGLSAF